MLSHFTIKRGKHYAPNWFNCLNVYISFWGKVSHEAWEINAVMKRRDINCVGILSDQGANCNCLKHQ